MASIFLHATQGGLLHGGICLACGAHPVITSAAVTLGVIAGAGADLLGWAGRNAGIAEEYAVYKSAHRGPIARALRWIPAYGLHLLVDKPFHTKPGNWWCRMWWAEGLLWVVNAGVIWWFI